MSEELTKYEISETDKAYAAGLFDGEGCITVHRCARTSRVYNLMSQISMTDELELLWFQSNFGGKVYKHNNSKPTWRPTYMWRLQNRKAAAFLLCILPYLKIKRRRAELGVQLGRMYYPQGRIGRAGLPTAEIAERNRLASEIRAENFSRSSNGKILNLVN